MLYGPILAIHAGAMLAALLSFVAGELLLIFARRGQSTPARMAVRASSAGDLMATVGVLAGVTLVFVGGWPLLTPWLLASLALVATLMMVQRVFVRPWEARVRVALTGDASPMQIKVFANERTALIGRATVIALFGMVAGLMTMKPALALFP